MRNAMTAKLSGPPQTAADEIRAFNVGLQDRWGRPQFYGLCRSLDISQEAMGALVGLTANQTVRYLSKGLGRFPLPVCILLQTIEDYIVATLSTEKHGDTPRGRFITRAATRDRFITRAGTLGRGTRTGGQQNGRP